MRTHLLPLLVAVSFALTVSPVSKAGDVETRPNVKVTRDNNNVDGLVATPSFDARNNPQRETSVAISPVDPNTVVIASNDLRLFDETQFETNGSWIGINVSIDGGATWFNTMIPGFAHDTSAAGATSPLKRFVIASSSDPTVRFDAAGNFYVSGLVASGIGPNPKIVEVPDNLTFVSKYNYIPGTRAGVSTPNAAGNPPNFMYAFTTIVDRGAISVLPFPAPPKAPGQFDDKPWLGVDKHRASPCFGNVYMAFTPFHGVDGTFPTVFSRSTDGGVNFSAPVVISQKGQDGSPTGLGTNIAVGTDGRIYVSYSRFSSTNGDQQSVSVVRSDDCGLHFSKPVQAVVSFITMQLFEPGLTFRTPTLPWVAVDDTNSDVVYVAYTAKQGSPSHADVFVARSIDGGTTWGAPVKANDDATNKHQFFPAITVSNGALHVAWYDLRDSANPGSPEVTNGVLGVYYASSNTSSAFYPAFSQNVKVSDAGFDPFCTDFIGDYIELAAHFDGAQHVVHVAWTDLRDIPPDLCHSTDFVPLHTGVFNENIYTGRLLVAP
jgi:hypothetical protein